MTVSEYERRLRAALKQMGWSQTKIDAEIREATNNDDIADAVDDPEGLGPEDYAEELQDQGKHFKFVGKSATGGNVYKATMTFERLQQLARSRFGDKFVNISLSGPDPDFSAEDMKDHEYDDYTEEDWINLLHELATGGQ